MGRTVVDIPYSDCANTVWRGQYFWRKNFYLAIMLSKAENRGGGHQGDGNTAPGLQQHQNIWPICTLIDHIVHIENYLSFQLEV